MVDVAVCVLTFRRNDDLRELLPELLEHLASAERSLPFPVTAGVLVVDNDPDGGAEPVVAPYVGSSPVRYVAEPTPGIAAARNRALDEAPPEGLVVFLDDDERPLEGWFEGMVTTWHEHRSAAVGGPVEAVLRGDVDPWIVAGGFFERDFRREFRTGHPVTVAPTGNLLLDMSRINAKGLRFDASIGLSGGEDTLFTRQLVDAGEQIIWCQEAAVLDPVPPSRLTRRWVMRRVFFVANASTRASLRTPGPVRRRLLFRARYATTGVARVLIGAAQLLTGTASRSPRRQARGAGTTARGLGATTAVLGLRFDEYRR